MSALQTLQMQFQAFVLGDQTSILQRIAGADGIDPARRLKIYYDAYRSRLLEALRTDYSGLLALMGRDEFDRMASAFVEATPSLHRNLRYYGGALPAYLQNLHPYAERPWLRELGLFEWTISESFDAADIEPMNFEQMAGIDPDHWPLLTFRLHPSCQRLMLQTNAVSLRKAADADEPLPTPETFARPTEWLLWRQDLNVMFKSLPTEEAWAFDEVLSGATFTDLCEGLCRWTSPDEAANHAAGMLRTWVDAQLITAAVPAPAP